LVKGKKRGGGGGGGGGFANAMQGPFGGSLMIIMGVVVLLCCLIAYTIVISQVDTSYTTAATYTEQKGLAQSMGLLPMIFFIFFMALGMASIVAGTVKNFKSAATGASWQEIMGGIMGAVTVVIVLVLNDLIQSQLHTVYTTVNATVNKAHFAGVLGIIGIWGMVILWTLVGSCLTQVGGAVVGGVKKLKGA
jgi:hypothetical protein